MHTYSHAVTECRVFFKKWWKQQWTKWDSYVSVTLPQSPKKRHENVSSKPSVCNVKSSDGSPGRVLVSRVYKSACVMVFSSHVYEWPAKLENQRTADAKQSLWEQQFWDIFGEGNRNNELSFTLSFIWSSEDTEITLGWTVSKTFWKRKLLQMLRFI